MPYSKNALNCAKCPGKGGDGGCPMWWETVWENAESATKLVKGCGFEQLPMYLIEVVKASNRPAAAVEATRNEIAAGLAAIAKSAALVPRLGSGHDVRQALPGPGAIDDSDAAP